MSRPVTEKQPLRRAATPSAESNGNKCRMESKRLHGWGAMEWQMKPGRRCVGAHAGRGRGRGGQGGGSRRPQAHGERAGEAAAGPPGQGQVHRLSCGMAITCSSKKSGNVTCCSWQISSHALVSSTTRSTSPAATWRLGGGWFRQEDAPYLPPQVTVTGRVGP